MGGKALGVMISVDAVADPAAITGAANAAATGAAAATTQVAVTDALDGATFTGTALTTSATPTVDELEAIAGSLGLAVNAAGTDIAAQKVELDQVITDVGLVLAQADKSTVDIGVLRTNQIAILTALKELGLMEA